MIQWLPNLFVILIFIHHSVSIYKFNLFRKLGLVCVDLELLIKSIFDSVDNIQHLIHKFFISNSILGDMSLNFILINTGDNNLTHNINNMFILYPSFKLRKDFLKGATDSINRSINFMIFFSTLLRFISTASSYSMHWLLSLSSQKSFLSSSRSYIQYYLLLYEFF